jgi:CDP-diglyceride synthetase
VLETHVVALLPGTCRTAEFLSSLLALLHCCICKLILSSGAAAALHVLLACRLLTLMHCLAYASGRRFGLHSPAPGRPPAASVSFARSGITLVMVGA